MLKHPQFREMSSSRLKSFCKQLYQGQKKTSQGKGDLGDHSRSLLGGAPRKRSFVNGREMGLERRAGLTADIGPLSREASGFLAISLPDDGIFLGSACRS